MSPTIQNNNDWIYQFKHASRFSASFDAKDIVGKVAAVSLKSKSSEMFLFFIINAQNGKFLMINLKKMSKNHQKWLLAFHQTNQDVNSADFLMFLRQNAVSNAIETHNFKQIARILPILNKDNEKLTSFLEKGH